MTAMKLSIVSHAISPDRNLTLNLILEALEKVVLLCGSAVTSNFIEKQTLDFKEKK